MLEFRRAAPSHPGPANIGSESKRVCEKSRSSWLESFEHEMDHGYINPSLAGFR